MTKCQNTLAVNALYDELSLPNGIRAFVNPNDEVTDRISKSEQNSLIVFHILHVLLVRFYVTVGQIFVEFLLCNHEMNLHNVY